MSGCTGFRQKDADIGSVSYTQLRELRETMVKHLYQISQSLDSTPIFSSFQHLS